MMEKWDNPKHNKDLAEFYTSEMQKMRKLNQYFQNLLNTTPEAFDKYMQLFGEEYAKIYEWKWVKNYQSNANRLTGTLIAQILQESWIPPKYTKILDIASGPRMLRKHIVDTYQECITSLDGNPHHFPWWWDDIIVATLPSIPVEDQTYDVLHFSLALQDLAWNMRHAMFDRAKFFLEAHRVLKQHGTMVIQLPYRYTFKNTEQLQIVLDLLWFTIDQEKTGMAIWWNKYSSYILILHKKSDKTPWDRENILEKIYDYRDWLKLSRLPGNNREQPWKEFLEKFTLGERIYTIDLNTTDRDLKQEEAQVLEEMKSIIEYYWGITKIPREIILEKGYIYYAYGKNKQYKLMKTYSSWKWFIAYIGK